MPCPKATPAPRLALSDPHTAVAEADGPAPAVGASPHHKLLGAGAGSAGAVAR